MDASTTSNKIPLDAELVSKFRAFQSNIRNNTVEMASLAYDIRAQNISADGRKFLLLLKTEDISNQII
jgi:hypothetical protein